MEMILNFLKMKNIPFYKIKVQLIIHNSTKPIEKSNLYNSNLDIAPS